MHFQRKYIKIFSPIWYEPWNVFTRGYASITTQYKRYIFYINL